MLNTAKGYLQQDAWRAVAPGTAIFVTVLGFNFPGDAVRDALPRPPPSQTRQPRGLREAPASGPRPAI